MPLYKIDCRMVLFAHVPKAGGSSVEEFLSPFRVGLQDRLFYDPARAPAPFPCSPQHFHRALLDSLFRDDTIDYSFAVVRNPFDRLLSEYRFQKVIAAEPERYPPLDAWVERCFARYRNHPYCFDNHIRPMTQFVSERDEVFRLEDGLEVVVARLAEQFPAAIAPGARMPRVNATAPSGPAPFGPETRRMIRDFYQEDFQKWYPDAA